MKRKLAKGGSETAKKSKTEEDLSLPDSVRGNFNVKLFRRKLTENDFISGNILISCCRTITHPFPYRLLPVPARGTREFENYH